MLANFTFEQPGHYCALRKVPDEKQYEWGKRGLKNTEKYEKVIGNKIALPTECGGRYETGEFQQTT